jgi:hypothetical protein
VLKTAEGKGREELCEETCVDAARTDRRRRIIVNASCSGMKQPAETSQPLILHYSKQQLAFSMCNFGLLE